MKIREQIPNMLTLANLAMGCIAAVKAIDHNFEAAAFFALLALVFDFLDGTAARLLKVTSPVGKELDSLADVVSFGAVPALVLFTYWSDIGLGEFMGVPTAGIALLLPLFAAYRLAVFNVSPQSGEFFKGLPTPALAIVSYSIPLICMESLGKHLFLNQGGFAIAYVLIGGWLMISSIRLLSFKLGSSDKVLNRWRILCLFLFALTLVFFKFFGLILCLLMYLVISLTLQKIFRNHDV